MKDYIKIARIDHWGKNIFMLPGMALAFVITDISISESILPMCIAILSTCLIASANYVINEWLDAEFDQHHPVKKSRPSATGKIKAKYVYLEYIIIACTGLFLASLLSDEFLYFSAALLIMGILYNVKPIRTKDKVYLDVLSESVNNPLRLLLGWSALVSGQIPPSSILLSYWMGGAFLMAIKRFAEYRFIDDPDRASQYRMSFKHYTENSLLISSFFYALTSAFFLGIFLIKYRIEFLLSFPLFALLFSWYLSIGLKPLSPTQSPEKFYHEKKFMAYLIFLCIAIGLMFFVDMPFLDFLTEKTTY